MNYSFNGWNGVASRAHQLSIVDVLLIVDVLGEVIKHPVSLIVSAMLISHDIVHRNDQAKRVKVGAEVPELERGVDDGPDGAHLATVHALHPVGANVDVDAGEVLLVHPAADVVRRFQDQQVGYPGVRQPLRRRDP